MALQQLTADVLAEATGRRQRLDAIAPGGGGPAGNARLTAATGLVLLVLFLAELVTLLDVTGLIGWHVAIGVLLVPPALLKTASTGWRIVRYYGGDRDYRASGPPPMLLRLLGPLVVLSTLGLLGSGLALIALGPEASRYALIQALGQRVDAVTVHQAFFACWAVATGLHVLARLVPAVALAVRRSAVPGGRRRLAAIALTVIVAAITAALLLGTAAAWAHAGHPPALRPAPWTGLATPCREPAHPVPSPANSTPGTRRRAGSFVLGVRRPSAQTSSRWSLRPSQPTGQHGEMECGGECRDPRDAWAANHHGRAASCATGDASC